MTAPKSLWLRFCHWGLGILGIGSVCSCDAIENIIDGPACEYGCPTMEFVIKGKVVNAKDGKGIEGILVSPYQGATEATYGNVLTAGNGEFNISGSEFPDDSLTLYFKDMDGEKNGSFKELEQKVGLSKVKDGDGKWFEGTFSAENVVVEMQENTSSAENE